ncbi:hypothetical protein ALC62_10729 [Cyphomyrmex costatus]|uniref:Uncharacterized protein n=1 Tax=Cyphomyrmex costatus TaxID=456900 RepID=A0A195CEW0_9HYME|nr:hypothetical protein ALC62_10729 [Cyphomyrmex costatus]
MHLRFLHAPARTLSENANCESYESLGGAVTRQGIKAKSSFSDLHSKAFAITPEYLDSYKSLVTHVGFGGMVETTTRQQRTKEDEGTQWSEISLTLQPFHYTNGRLNLRCTAEIPGIYSRQSELHLLSAMREPVPARGNYKNSISICVLALNLQQCTPVDCIDAMHALPSVPICLIFRSSAPETPSIHVACIISRQSTPEAWIVVTQKEQCPAEENPLTFHLMALPPVSIPKGISTVDTPRPIVIGELWEKMVTFLFNMCCSNLRKRKRHAHDDVCDNTLLGHAPSASEIVTARLRPRKGSSRASHDK